ncbi:transmembrane sensor [Catalinimonas alkaloidigena]|uniref:FecR family protein n=1 Tax=Catalinimonas alkaloidigena TaxID=1075417 RepID=UPI0024060F38|nr:FecR domain-containing protein [Catalinimonas alkaloidigena]MDF9799391.1 transmembrane sensor [Catalinimonas alkaloidigena]
MTMNESNYLHYTVDDYAVDPSFRKWCLSEGETGSAFWETFLLRHPEKAEEIEAARRIVLGVDQHFASREASPASIESHYLQTLKTAQQRERTIKLKRQKLQFAAAITLLIAAAISFTYYTFSSSDESSLLVYRTDYGEQKTIQLPDSSLVRLNANSKLIINPTWEIDSLREVWLEGEAYFSVAKKPAHHTKFVVHAQELNVEVLGTQFNVNTMEGATEVVLDEGKIKLSKSDNTETITMSPGEMATFSVSTRRITKKQVNPQLYRSWKEGYLTYEEARLSEVLKDVQQTFGYTIVVKDSLLLEETISGALSSNDLDSLLIVLKDIIPKISFTQNDQQLIVTKKK